MENAKKTRDFSFKKDINCEKRKLFKKNFSTKTERKNKSFKKNAERQLNKIKKLMVCKSLNLDLKKKIKTIITVANNVEEKIEYIEEEELGKGAFGVCYLYESTKDCNLYAAKIVSKEKLEKDKSRQSIIEEINTQQSLDSPKVVKVKSYSEDNKNVYIILELCKNRSLADLVKKRHHLTEFEVRNYMFQLIQGVKYLHNQKIIHRDLKPNNIFLDEKLELKIGDFGLIAKINKDKERRYSVCGTRTYMAPEVIENGKKGYSFEVDIWSIGIIMYNLLTGFVPFYDKDNKKLNEKILKGSFTFPEEIEISRFAKDLIKQILVREPKKRPGLNQILYHDFFHIGTFPKYLDPSTLKSEPSKEYLRKYISEEEENSLLQKEITYKSLYKLIVDDSSEIKYKNIEKYTIKNAPKVKGIDYWISLFHKSHSGFCYYEINNGMVGIMYEGKENGIYDGLKLILNEKEDLFYEIIEEDNKEDEIITYPTDKCPHKLKEKYNKFLKYHNEMRKQILEHENQNQTLSSESISSITSINSKSESNEESSENECSKTISLNSILSEKETKNEIKRKIIYIKSYYQDKYAKFLVLSDDTKQIIFKDKIVILISDIKEVVGYFDKNKKQTYIPLINAMKNASKDFISRLKYIKRVNYSQIKKKMIQKIENNKNPMPNDNIKVEDNFSET